jgi:hypothetical protein
MRSFDAREKWNHEYPLIDRRLTRGDCVALVLRMGWPSPPRSSCWMCPYRTNAEWRHLKNSDPQDFAAAVAFDADLRSVDPTLYLHRSGVPLSDAEIGGAQGDLLDMGCASGMCFT